MTRPPDISTDRRQSDSPQTDRRPPLDRRAFLAGLGAGVVVATAGCSAVASNDEPASVPTPIALDGRRQDDQGGMLIGEHFGPNGELFYRDHTPNGHENPAWFHTLAHGLFPYHFERERLGWELVAAYVTDYTTVDYELVEQGDRTFISTHTGVTTFGDAREVTYVAGSRVLGGMGKELIPFGDTAEAEAFQDAHGGALVAFEDITQEQLLHYGHDHDH